MARQEAGEMPSFQLYVEENGIFVPLNRSDPGHMLPFHGYAGLPVRTTWNENGEVEHNVDFEMITILEFKEYFLSGPSWANIQLSDEDVEDLRYRTYYPS